MRDWLQIQPAPEHGVLIQEPYSHRATVIRNQIWYRGEAAELDQLYKQLGMYDSTNAARFWAAAPQNIKLRKIHTGLPALMVDTLAYLVKADMDDVAFQRDAGKSAWADITQELDFLSLVGKGVVGALRAGDGAFKISVDRDASQYPLVEFYEADRVDYIRRHGRIVGLHFWTPVEHRDRRFDLRETYEPGSVRYALFDEGREISLDAVPELADLRPVQFDGDFIMAVPLRFYDSPRFPGRGKALYESKLDDFDALDEVVSQWWDAIRAGRVKKYIPRDFMPTNPRTGEPLLFDDFGSEYLITEPDIKEGALNKVETIQPEIRYEAFLASYTAALDMCLQGIMSPATLGIDVGKMASAEAQREKKDVTGYTRNTITGALEQALPELIRTILQTYDVMRGDPPGAYEPSVSFGEYGAPSFDARAETINKAAAAGTMSVETQVEELWGSSKDEDWKAAEVARIKAMRGLEEAAPPAVGGELIGLA